MHVRVCMRVHNEKLASLNGLSNSQKAEMTNCMVMGKNVNGTLYTPHPCPKHMLTNPCYYAHVRSYIPRHIANMHA